ncbi:hypothetical protein, partial [Pontibacter saemangeumensis]|uniref:hypothetical protein n=1 Tax=Pontibacter saemangeumensis TaxID=1084525 RepID=UPI0031EB4096
QRSALPGNGAGRSRVYNPPTKGQTGAVGIEQRRLPQPYAPGAGAFAMEAGVQRGRPCRSR